MSVLGTDVEDKTMKIGDMVSSGRFTGILLQIDTHSYSIAMATVELTNSEHSIICRPLCEFEVVA